MNRGEDGGVIALLRNDYPCIAFMWCVAKMFVFQEYFVVTFRTVLDGHINTMR